MFGLTLLAKILAILGLTGTFAHPDFSKKDDVERLLYTAALASQTSTSVLDQTFPNDHKYTVSIDDNHLYLGEGEPGSLGGTSIHDVVKTSTQAGATFSNFKKLRRFYEELIEEGKFDVGEFAEIGVAFESTFITDKTVAELNDLLSGEAAYFKNLKNSTEPIEQLRYKTARNLINLRSEDIIEKIYDRTRAEQSYVIQGQGSFPTYVTLIDLGKK